MTKLKWAAGLAAFAAGSAIAQAAFAHAVVTPAKVGVGAEQTFSLAVASEQDVPTVGVRLLLPAGLDDVTPNVKPGWTITAKTAEGGGDAVTEISWSGGSIPPGQQDQFLFSAQVPAQAGQLPWKVYQTYQNGNVVSWDQPPGAAQPTDSSGNPDFSKVGPYSQTEVVNDLTPAPPGAEPAAGSANKSNLPLVLSIVALALSVIALARSNNRP